LVRILYQNHREVWVQEGKPSGLIWLPPESPGYFQRLRSEFYGQRLASRWLFSTPDWMREDALALRLLKRMRVLTLVWNVGVLIYIYVIISHRQL